MHHITARALAKNAWYAYPTDLVFEHIESIALARGYLLTTPTAYAIILPENQVTSRPVTFPTLSDHPPYFQIWAAAGDRTELLHHLLLTPLPPYICYQHRTYQHRIYPTKKFIKLWAKDHHQKHLHHPHPSS